MTERRIIGTAVGALILMGIVGWAVWLAAVPFTAHFQGVPVECGRAYSWVGKHDPHPEGSDSPEEVTYVSCHSESTHRVYLAVFTIVGVIALGAVALGTAIALSEHRKPSPGERR